MGEKVETVIDIFLGSKITADGDCGHKIKRRLLLGRKVMTNLDSILKSRGITLPTKVRLVKAMVFPVVMYGCESWIIKKAEHGRIDAFKLWCWRRLESPLDCKGIQPVNPKENQSCIFIWRTDAEAPVLWPPDAKSQLIWEILWCWERLSAVGQGSTEDETVGWHHWLNEHVFEQTPRRWWRTGKPGVLQFMGSQRPGYDLVTEQQARLGDLVQLRFWHHFGSQNWGHSISIWPKEIIARLFCCLLWYYLLCLMEFPICDFSGVAVSMLFLGLSHVSPIWCFGAVGWASVSPVWVLDSCFIGTGDNHRMLAEHWGYFAAAAAAAKSLQSCPTLCDPIDGSPPGSPVPGILESRTQSHVKPQAFICMT